MTKKGIRTGEFRKAIWRWSVMGSGTPPDPTEYGLTVKAGYLAAADLACALQQARFEMSTVARKAFQPVQDFWMPMRGREATK